MPVVFVVLNVSPGNQVPGGRACRRDLVCLDMCESGLGGQVFRGILSSGSRARVWSYLGVESHQPQNLKMLERFKQGKRALPRRFPVGLDYSSAMTDSVNLPGG